MKTFKYIIIFGLLLAGTTIVWKLSQANNDTYNKYMCANYGYQADCKTPLAENERLK